MGVVMDRWNWIASAGFVLALFSCALVLNTCLLGPNAQDKKQAELQYDMGVDAFSNQHYRQALDHFMRSLDLNANSPEAYYGLASLQAIMGKNEEALAHLAKAQNLVSENQDRVINKTLPSKILATKGRVLMNLNRFRLAIPLLQKALEDVFCPERYIAESNLGWAVYQVGDKDRGIKHIMNALALNEKYCMGYEYLGLIYKKSKDYQMAIREFKSLLTCAPEYANAMLLLGQVFLMAGQEEPGCRYLDECKKKGRMSRIGRQCDRLFRSVCQTSMP
jgi:type IV pilus assembly protein PilF